MYFCAVFVEVKWSKFFIDAESLFSRYTFKVVEGQHAAYQTAPKSHVRLLFAAVPNAKPGVAVSV